MNDTDKQRLTSFLGLDWIDYKIPTNDYEARNRDFTTPQDVFDLKDRLVEKELFDDFLDWAEDAWFKDPCSKTPIEWLFRCTDESGKPHFARLVSEFLEGEK